MIPFFPRRTPIKPFDPNAITICLNPIGFTVGDQIGFPQKWESVHIPLDLNNAILDTFFPTSEITVKEADEKLRLVRRRWFRDLRAQGFNAVRGFNKGRSYFAEATKEEWK